MAVVTGLLASLPAMLRIGWDLSWHSALRKAAIAGPPGKSAPHSDTSSTLILCTHNDLQCLQKMWPYWIGQEFPKDWQVEWLVVDDGSTDGTAMWLEEQRVENPRLTVLRHQKRTLGKKAALAAGIKAARFDRLVMTDADCLPEPFWAFKMASALGNPTDKEGLDAALGLGLPKGGPDLLRFDAHRIAFQYLGEAAAGRPYMGVGRSLAYRRSLWEQIGGFQSHMSLTSGDDDLFIQEAVTKGFRVGPGPRPDEGWGIFSMPASGLVDGWQRKRRHLSTAGKYRKTVQVRLAVDTMVDPLVLLAAAIGASGLLHILCWIPLGAMVLAFAVRTHTLSVFSKEWGRQTIPMWKSAILGPLRWIGLASATLGNALTSSPTWTQRAPTSRS